MNIPPATLALKNTGKSAMNRDMTAAIRAGVEAGVVGIKSLSDSRELAPGDQRAVGGEAER